MTEEVKNEGTEKPETSEREYSAVEQKALDQGWVPKEDFNGDEKEFIDAPEFVRRGELFSKIEHQSKEVKALRQALEAFKEHHSKVKETEYKRALKQLDAARREAVKEGEHERAFAIEEKMDEITDEKAEFDAEVESIPTAAPRINPVFELWQNNNAWYGKDKAMTAFADELGRDLRNKVLSGEMSQEDVFSAISKEVRTEFKHKFSSTKTGRAPAVESSSRGGRTSSSGFQMDDGERAIMRKIVATGVMTEQEYMKQLKETKEV